MNYRAFLARLRQGRAAQPQYSRRVRWRGDAGGITSDRERMGRQTSKWRIWMGRTAVLARSLILTSMTMRLGGGFAGAVLGYGYDDI